MLRLRNGTPALTSFARSMRDAWMGTVTPIHTHTNPRLSPNHRPTNVRRAVRSFYTSPSLSSVSSVSSSGARRPNRTVPASMVEQANRITREFEFDTTKSPSSSSTPQPSASSNRNRSSSEPEPLSSAVSALTQFRHYAVRQPCHPSSLFSRPVLNNLRAILHSKPFVKMVVRASVNLNGWKIEPDWDFDSSLDLPTQRQHPNYLRHQELLHRTMTASPSHPAQSSADSSSNNDPTPSPASTSTPEPFTKAQIEGNLADFILSPTLHQSKEIMDVVLESQRRYFQLADEFKAKYEKMPWSQYASHDKRVKTILKDAWTWKNNSIYYALVTQFVKFMEEPVDESAEPPSTDTDSLTAAIGRTPQPKASVVESLLKSRSGRLRFDPTLVGLSNLSAPHEWYPIARSIQRKIIIHVGPTNSGKTYHAMQRLMSAGSGVYCGPLRLLAWEVYDKMCKKGVPCNLRTGQESQVVEDARHTSSTVEMVSTSTIYDVAVIDEGQLLASSDRGWAWTRALLGVAAYEIHVCGDPSMVEVIEELAAITGEEVEVREYERLTPLKVSPPLANGLRDIRKGDCIVAFSQKMLYRLKHDIEHQLGLKCCIIYGSLPPETRRDQAEKFNDPNSGYDVLVSTDAIGMGLNLNIQRIIFARMDKFDGFITRPLTVSETLQIAGRAGRFGTNNKSTSSDGSAITTMAEAAESNCGYVTTLHPDDHAYLQWALVQKLQPFERAGLAPTQEQLETLHALRPKERLSNLVTYFAQYAQLDQLYFNVDMEGFKQIADLIDHIPFNSISIRYDFCRAPARPDGGPITGAIVRFAELFAAQQPVFLKSYQVPAAEIPKTAIGMSALEALYQITELYVWLGLRFGEDAFPDLYKAMDLLSKTAAIIASGLERMSPPDAYLAQRRNVVAAQLQAQKAHEARVEAAMKKAEAKRKKAMEAAQEEDEENGPSISTPSSSSSSFPSSNPPPTYGEIERQKSQPFVGRRKDKPVMKKHPKSVKSRSLHSSSLPPSNFKRNRSTDSTT